MSQDPNRKSSWCTALSITGIVAVLACIVRYGTSLERSQEPFPNRPIRLIVTWNPGTSVDIACRTIAQSNPFSQRLVVINRPGGMGIRGQNIAAKARADGYLA